VVITGVHEMKEQTEIGKIKEGRYVVIDDEPCRVLGIATSKPGKHGAAKARIDAVGIFDGVKRSIVSPVSAKAYIPVVERKSGQVISIAGNTAQLMDMKDFTNFEIPIPEDRKSIVEIGKEIVYIESMGKRKFD
jgi:translation initiation factor 5A